MLKFRGFQTGLLVLCLATSACSKTVDKKDPGQGSQPVLGDDGRACTREQAASIELGENERLITILGTNDIHGGIEPFAGEGGRLAGGMAQLAGSVRAIRDGLEERYGSAKAGVLVLDGGDQFQGTLLSNFSEGMLMVKTMNQVMYDAVVPGNHDYDFGPIGWMEDRVNDATEDKNTRGAFLRVIKNADFPFISANTYVIDSLVDATTGQPVPVKSEDCAPVDQNQVIAWSSARRVDFLQPYVIKNVAGVRVAMIGIDFNGTAAATTGVNVADLCYRAEADAYSEVRADLEGQADVFVMVMHQGYKNGDAPAKKILEKIIAKGPNQIHAVVAGHTHTVDNLVVENVPLIQSGANGERFGRIDLVWDAVEKKVVANKLRHVAGIRMLFNECDKAGDQFCSLYQGKECTQAETTQPYFEGIRVLPDRKVNWLIADGLKDIAPIKGRLLGHAEKAIKRDYVSENALANLLTDALREATGAQISFMNNGGIRTNIKPGDLTYEDLFRVLPFNNRAVLMGQLKVKDLFALLTRSAQSCGKHGSVMQSGLHVVFEKDCKSPEAQAAGEDKNTKLVYVANSVTGDKYLDVDNGITPPEDLEFTIATLDFLRDGGSGYIEFKQAVQLKDIAIARDVIADQLAKSPGGELRAEVDGRWKSRKPKTP